MDSIRVFRFLMFYIAVASLAMLISCSNEEKTPILEVSPTTLDFGERSEVAWFNIANAGGNILHWYIEDIPDWLSIEPTMGETVSEIAVKASVDREEIGPGSHEAKLGIMSNGGNVVLEVLAETPQPSIRFSVSGMRITVHSIGLCTYDIDTYGATAFKSEVTCTLGESDYRNPTGDEYKESHVFVFSNIAYDGIGRIVGFTVMIDGFTYVWP